MNISLPDSLKTFVDEQVSQRGYGTRSEYVRELILKDQQGQQLRCLLLEGASSARQVSQMLLISSVCSVAWKGISREPRSPRVSPANAASTKPCPVCWPR
ncbi:MAG: hypothetical protein U0938_10520 [Thiobacillus sp.]|nr:hypothetical protein [Thiobacillus sp.]